MKSNFRTIDEIRLKVLKLLDEKSALEQERESLKNTIKLLKEKQVELENSIERLEEKNKISKLAVGIQLSKQDKSEIKRQLDRYIREIDECIRLLNQ